MKKSYFIISLLLLVLLCSGVFGTTLFESVTKVHAGSSRGTGNCINIDDDYVYLTTNKHVIGNNKNVRVQFYRDGYESHLIPAEVIWTAYRSKEPVDIALLRVSRTLLGDWIPTVVEFENDPTLLEIGDTITTIGCPNAGWPKASKGHIVEIENGCYKFTPTVVPGQSGSLLMNADGTKAVGLIAWYQGNYGKAMTAETIQKAVLGEPTEYVVNQEYDCSEDVPVAFVGFRDDCGPDGCERPLFRRRQNPNRPQRPDPNTRPLEPKNPFDKNPETPEDDSDGIKIFPNYPDQEEKDKDEVTPTNPEDKKDDMQVIPTKPINMSALEKRVVDLENNLKKNSELDITLKTTVDGLNTTLSSKANKTDIVSQQSIQDLLKTTEQKFANISVVNEVSTKVDIMKDSYTQMGQLMLDAIKAKTAESQVTETSVYHDYGNTMVSAGIPSFVLLILGYWGRKLLARYLDDLKSRLGGTVPTSPFQKPAVVTATKK